MKNLSIFIFLSLFSILAFAEEEQATKPITTEEEVEVSKEEVKTAIQKIKLSEETKPTEETEPTEETKLTEETEPVASEEEIEPVVQEVGDTASAVSTGVQYECDEGKSYTLYEPGTTSESNLCELDAGHTETPADWYALYESSFCRQKLQEMISLHNCSEKN